MVWKILYTIFSSSSSSFRIGGLRAFLLTSRFPRRPPLASRCHPGELFSGWRELQALIFVLGDQFSLLRESLQPLLFIGRGAAAEQEPLVSNAAVQLDGVSHCNTNVYICKWMEIIHVDIVGRCHEGLFTFPIGDVYDFRCVQANTAFVDVCASF